MAKSGMQSDKDAAALNRSLTERPCPKCKAVMKLAMKWPKKTMVFYCQNCGYEEKKRA